MCIILCILSRKTNTYFKKKINVKGIKKNSEVCTHTLLCFCHFFIISNYKLMFFKNPQAYQNKSATLTSGLENIYKKHFTSVPQKVISYHPDLVKFLLLMVLLNSTHHSNREVNKCVINYLHTPYPQKMSFSKKGICLPWCFMLLQLPNGKINAKPNSLPLRFILHQVYMFYAVFLNVTSTFLLSPFHLASVPSPASEYWTQTSLTEFFKPGSSLIFLFKIIESDTNLHYQALT